MQNTCEISFADDILYGLSQPLKHIPSKYLYDKTGSDLFRDIMNMPEYYLTNCELEIFETCKEDMYREMFEQDTDSSIIELGAGDGLKTKVLLRHFLERRGTLTYIPIDICDGTVRKLADSLRMEFPALQVEEKAGDYFEVMHELDRYDSQPRIILFLGSNIGNYSYGESREFLRGLRELMNDRDRLLIGFDLIKEPTSILAAYNDPYGYTREFNMNILERINRELDADFNAGNFMHYEHYSPASGAAESYLISTREQTVTLRGLEREFTFMQWEPIFIEISQKYDMDMIRRIAAENGFEIVADFFDKRRWFVDSLWQLKAQRQHR